MCCGVAGYIKVDSRGNDQIVKYIANTTTRGRDAFGLIGFSGTSMIMTEELKIPYRVDYSSVWEKISGKLPKIAVASSRAGPVTEEFRDSLINTPPFTDDTREWFVVLNGVIANDKELKKEFGFEPDSQVDTAVLPYLFREFGFEEGINKIRGGWAIIAVNEKEPDTLYLSCNFRPLYIIRDEYNNIIVGSEKWNYEFENNGKLEPLKRRAEYLGGYGIWKATSEGITKLKTIARNIDKEKRVLVIASGGMDSTTVCRMAEVQGYKPVMLHFNYKQKAQENEIRAVEQLSKKMNWELLFVELPMFEVFQSSSLINKNLAIKSLDESYQEPKEYVNCRNLIFMSLAVGLAEEKGINYVSMGINLDDASAYSDNEVDAYAQWNKIAHCFVKSGSKVEFLDFTGRMVKHDIAREGTKIKVPYELTTSCYYEGDDCYLSRNVKDWCGPSYARFNAFKMEGIVDPLYLTYIEERKERVLDLPDKKIE